MKPTKFEILDSSFDVNLEGTGDDSDEEDQELTSLIEVTVDALHGLGDDIPEWEEIEFMVDSGAGTTVITPDEVKAVKPSESHPTRN